MDTPPAAPSAADLRARLPQLMLHDERRLRRRLDGRNRRPRKGAAATVGLAEAVAEAEARVERRRAAVPPLRYPAQLPVSQRKDDILAAIRDHQVVVVAGETGSGKTTQIPKICLELGRGVRGMVGHTQPRRLAARAVADRIAEELETPLGGVVGYQVRFADRVGDDTLVKLMTDGILLAEIQHDRDLLRYDTIIIDEAHERSLNIDFLLGYLAQLLPRRPDLKVVITSATIDPERFARHFGDAPVVEVSGRTYPVEVRYRPLVEESDDDERPGEVRDQVQAIVEAVDELCAEGPGDILVFLSGEREIRDTADALRAARPDVETLPLFARLSSAEQHRVFSPHPGRRVVLATNVAETSLTVPGIRYVVDPGTARISRYSHRTKVQRLPIEAISQASANQRKGRCGRLEDGVCIRLYSEDDFVVRPEFTDPEILRTSLAAVILQMAALGLGEVAAFPFIDPPDRRQVAAGVQLLEELGALDPAAGDPRRRLTPLGRKLAQIPVDPRLGRMVLEADRNGCLREVLVVAAALSIQDPRERPLDHQQAADQKHARFVDKDSDFLTYLALWRYLREQQKALSSNQFRRLCKAEYLNYLRVREWQDLYAQLRQATRSLGMNLSSAPDDRDGVHRSLLAGLLSHVGLKDPEKQDYLGARNTRFAIFPGSALFKKSPRWVMAAELVETSRLWGRVVARIEPEWVERLAGHLVKRSYSEPHWEKDRGGVVAFEKVTLYGVPLVASRKVDYGRIDPELSRELFIRHALVEGDWRTWHAFFHDNRRLLEDAEELEHRARRRDIVVDDEALFEFYDRRIPADVVSGRHFDAWWKQTRRNDPGLLVFSPEMLVTEDAGQVSADDFPDDWVQGDLRLHLSYRFEPGAADDGVTVQVPLPVLSRLRAEDFSWQVPGLREELAVALIRSLPKSLRRAFVPVPDHARAALAHIPPGGSLAEALSRELHRSTGVSVPRDAWRPDQVPDHLRMSFRVVDGQGRVLAEGRDLEALQQRFAARTRAVIAQAAGGLEREGVRTWDFGPLPKTFTETRDGLRLEGFPALADEGGSVAVRVFGTEAEQRRAMAAGTRRLLLLNLPSPLKPVVGGLRNDVKLALSHNPHGGVAALLDDCVRCAVDALVAGHGGPVWEGAAFAVLLEQVRGELVETVSEVVAVVGRVLATAHDVDRRLTGTTSAALAGAVADMRAQLSALVYPGFVSATGHARLPDLERYLRAIARRLDRLPDDPHRDRERQAQVERVQQAYQEEAARHPAGSAARKTLDDVRWMIEELRVSLFAQTLGTAHPVSEKRILRAMDGL